MKQENLRLGEIAERSGDRVVARLEGEIDDRTAKLWGEEFAASGGGKTPPTTPGPDPH